MTSFLIFRKIFLPSTRSKWWRSRKRRERRWWGRGRRWREDWDKRWRWYFVVFWFWHFSILSSSHWLVRSETGTSHQVAVSVSVFQHSRISSWLDFINLCWDFTHLSTSLHLHLDLFDALKPFLPTPSQRQLAAILYMLHLTAIFFILGEYPLSCLIVSCLFVYFLSC